MHVSFCMHFCRLQAYAEAQVYLMQECHASVACNLHVYLYIWRLMRNMMRDHPQPVRRRVAKGRAFLRFHRLPVQPSRLAVSAILKITCAKTINSLVPVYVTPFQIGSWRLFSFLRSKQFPAFPFFRPFCTPVLSPPVALLSLSFQSLPRPKQRTARSMQFSAMHP